MSNSAGDVGESEETPALASHLDPVPNLHFYAQWVYSGQMSNLESQSGKEKATFEPIEGTPSEEEGVAAKDVKITGQGIIYTVATSIGEALLGGIGL